jgi:hypothetical protein
MDKLFNAQVIEEIFERMPHVNAHENVVLQSTWFVVRKMQSLRNKAWTTYKVYSIELLGQLILRKHLEVVTRPAFIIFSYKK